MEPLTSPTTCVHRRARLAEEVGASRVAIPAGRAPARNFPANTYPFRASSHFLYLVGASLEGAVLVFEDGEPTLFAAEPDAADALWHGPTADLPALEQQLSLATRPLSELPDWLGRAPFGTTPLAIPGASEDPELSERLIQALVGLRLVHDAEAIEGLREAAEASVAAHLAGMARTRPGLREWHVQAAMEQALTERGCTTAYSSIVTVHGEVLHNHAHHRPLRDGDLLLADVGAETPGGWAGDITRTWPVIGRFSPTQRDMYEVVLRAQDAALDMVAPGVRFRDVHMRAALALAEGLTQLGILKGEAAARVEDGSHALFMPHGIGHLLGLDVHDMEDLGDRAGYTQGHRRSDIFGLSNLRLDRALSPGMAVTIEPGFYRIEALLRDPASVGLSADQVDLQRLEQFDDVRGIRIEDDVLVTEQGAEVLTAKLPKDPATVESLVGTG